MVYSNFWYKNALKKTYKSVVKCPKIYESLSIITRNDRGKLCVNGGRVINVTGFGANLEIAIKNTYKSIKNISFKNMYFRKDIGQKGLRYLAHLSSEDKNDWCWKN